MRHTETQVYKRALELVVLSGEVMTGLPPGYGFLSDQLRRASSSIVLNIAEGWAKPTAADQRRFFAIAKGSAYEVAAALDVAHSLRIIPRELHAKGTDACDHIAAMLYRLAQTASRFSARR